MMHRKVMVRIYEMDPVAIGVVIGIALGAIFAVVILAVR